MMVELRVNYTDALRMMARLRQQVGIDRPMKPGRNDPCCCGSGKKFKRCCLRREGRQCGRS